ncbi:non-ribosomal peptide synthetase [Streptomyces sp. NBC_00557]|uniref:non-ribosomal peptide synthetase n=1 Tax=Streptomyces sp. NBC_00557 TaxID=2975776 RepID=UPI002E7FB63E|nr:non-ribosomal peptide synthetase [Streptomyces sp. NBC_00557]WUC40333.1 non-ribosomal peptide synthetase [Streptomyces sp. NBC_00557]
MTLPQDAAPAGRLLHELVAAQAAATPDAVAVEAGDDRVTYAELDTRADQLAWVLRERGVGPDAVVGVCLRRGIELVVSYLAVLKAGGAYLALDPADPGERLAYTIDNAGAGLVLSEPGIAADWPQDAAARVLDVRDAEKEAAATVRQGPPPAELTGEHCAYVIYTSGSTGRPKGVLVPHQGIVNLSRWNVRTHQITGEDRYALLARVAFDAICWETWGALAGGATLVAAPETVKQDPDATLAWLGEQGITVAFLPPLLAERLYDSPYAQQVKLRVLLTGSDRLAQHPPAGVSFTVYNHYGPTEYSVIGAAGPVPAGAEGAPVLGTPIDGTEVYVLDDRGERVPAGETGEIHLSGVGLARGYLNRTALTAEKFLPDPFSAVPGARMYATGDLGHWNPDGTLSFEGRADRQVKIRGYRVECGEVETRLLAHPFVRETAVVAAQDSSGAARLVAYIVSAPGHEPTEGELRDHLGAALPDWMIPSVYHPLTSLPKNANGKVDHAQLPDPHTERPDTGTDFVGPRNAREETIARIWAEVLSLDTVGVYDNFFDLGGHSLLATEIVEQIATELDVDLDVRAIFDYPTIAELSTSLT